jgi:hypothetical protein
MFIEKEGLQELVEKRLEIKDRLLAKKSEMENLNSQMHDIAKSSEQDHLDFQEVNKEINKLVLMEAWDKCDDTVMPKEVILKDGKPFVELLDLVDDVKQKVADAKQVWKDEVEKD